MAVEIYKYNGDDYKGQGKRLKGLTVVPLGTKAEGTFNIL